MKPVLVGLMLLALAAVALCYVALNQKTTPNSPRSTPSDSESRRDACQRLVYAARNRAVQAADRRAKEFSAFVNERTSGARAFAEEMTSLYAKWRLVKAKLPFTDGDGHRQFIEEAFARHLFSRDELNAAFQRSIEFALRDLEQTENELAVDLRREILGWSHAQKNSETTQAQFEKALDEMLKSARWDAAKSVGGLTLSELASQIGGQILVRLAISGGLLGAGAANSWYTFGATLVAGLIADLIIEWIDDPVGDIERELRAALDKLAREGRDAIQAELNRIVEARASGWAGLVEKYVR